MNENYTKEKNNAYIKKGEQLGKDLKSYSIGFFLIVIVLILIFILK